MMWRQEIDIGGHWNAVLIEVPGKRHRFRMANSAADFDRLVAFPQGLPAVRLGQIQKGSLREWQARAGHECMPKHFSAELSRNANLIYVKIEGA